jgi:anaerobic magnesium-protoporphyrin IX monomethyl ester cyclase
MRILLIHPPYFKLFGSFNNRINIGLHSLAEILAAAGIQPAILNLDHREKNVLPTRHAIFQASSQPEAQELEKAIGTLEKQIRVFQPDFLLYSIGDVANPSVDFGSPSIATLLAKKIQKLFPGLFQIAYGPFVEKHASPVFDLILFGNAEAVILSYLQKQKRGFHTVSSPEKSFEKIPFLTLDYNVFGVNPEDFDYIWYSRGCSHHCSFCSLPVFSKNKILFRSSGRFVEEIRFRHNTYGVRDFYFTDSTFNAFPEKMGKVCAALQEASLPVQWRCDCRLDLLNPLQARRLKNAGCSFVKVGVEAMSDERLLFLQKGISVRQIQNKIRLLKESGLKVVVYILLGHPDYSEDSYWKELELFEELDADKYTVSILNPAPGSRMFRQFQWKGKQLPPVSHLDSSVAGFWGIPDRVLEAFFQLETSRGREDADVRSYIGSE